MTKFVLEILKEKEAEYDAERKQGSYQSEKIVLLIIIFLDQDLKTTRKCRCLFLSLALDKLEIVRMRNDLDNLRDEIARNQSW